MKILIFLDKVGKKKRTLPKNSIVIKKTNDEKNEQFSAVKNVSDSTKKSKSRQIKSQNKSYIMGTYWFHLS